MENVERRVLFEWFVCHMALLEISGGFGYEIGPQMPY